MEMFFHLPRVTCSLHPAGVPGSYSERGGEKREANNSPKAGPTPRHPSYGGEQKTPGEPIVSAIGVGSLNLSFSRQGVTLVSSRGNLQNKTGSLPELTTAWGAHPNPQHPRPSGVLFY